MCGRYTVMQTNVDDLAARFDAIFSTWECLEVALGRYAVYELKDGHPSRFVWDQPRPRAGRGAAGNG
jgi:hypothetical protein